MSTEIRVRQLDENGNALSDVNLRQETYDGLSAEEKTRLVVLEDESTLDALGRSRGPSVPPAAAAATGTGDATQYDALTVEDLKAEVARRDEARAAATPPLEPLLASPSQAKKADLIAALVADDADAS